MLDRPSCFSMETSSLGLQRLSAESAHCTGDSVRQPRVPNALRSKEAFSPLPQEYFMRGAMGSTGWERTSGPERPYTFLRALSG